MERFPTWAGQNEPAPGRVGSFAAFSSLDQRNPDVDEALDRGNELLVAGVRSEPML
jgi:hypothetical protein